MAVLEPGRPVPHLPLDPVDLPLTGFLWEPAWSSDGGWIAISNQPNARSKSDIYVVRPDGTGLKRLTENAAIDGAPRWSPDDGLIAFFSDRDGNWEIYVMESGGSDPRNLTKNGAKDYSPSWSPDGERIAFVSDRDGNDEIYVMNKDGGDARRLTFNKASDFDPAWSPDGKSIAFASARDGNDEIYVMSAPGAAQEAANAAMPEDEAGLKRLTIDPASDFGPAWRPLR
jgi:Tol biopolymer transport system component